MKGLHHAECCLNDVAIGSPQHISLCLVLGSCHHQLASLYHKMSFDSSVRERRERRGGGEQSEGYVLYLKIFFYLVSYSETEADTQSVRATLY